MSPPQRIGSDHVSRAGKRLTILSPADMPDWEVRSFRRPAILIRGERFSLVRKETLATGRIRYTLEPWPEEWRDPAGKTIVYDEDFVERRDRLAREVALGKAVHLFLVPIQPLLGYLPGTLKSRLALHYGINDEAVTTQSILVSFVVANTTLVTLPLWMGLPETRAFLGPTVVLAVLLLVDAGARYHYKLKEMQYQYGLFEWLLRRRQ